MYFTDGKGIFPERMPPYDVAFLLMQKEYEEIEVPCWAMKLYLDEEELFGEEREGRKMNIKRAKTGDQRYGGSLSFKE